MDIASSAFWMGLLQIIGIDMVLSGDNALVIALACRSLPLRQRKWGIILGTGAAIALRIVFAVAIVYLLEIPFLKLVGAVLLAWVAIKLVMPEKPPEHHLSEAPAATSLWSAVRIVMVADAVMSLDNVLAVAAAAKGSVVLLVLGIGISIPLIVMGSAMMLWLMDRIPLLVVAGSGLLGWIAGQLAVHDPIAGAWMAETAPLVHASLPYVLCGGVVLLGLYLRRRPPPPRASAVEARERPAGAKPH